MRKPAAVYVLAPFVALLAAVACSDAAEFDDMSSDADDLRKVRCGNGVCSGGETCSSCPSDCGACVGADASSDTSSAADALDAAAKSDVVTKDAAPDPNRNHYYVATTGNDSTGNGSKASPWATIGKAASSLTLGAAGAVVHVASGTYAPSAGISTSRSGTATARIQYLSDVKWGAKIAPAGAYFVWTQSGQYVDVDGFEVAGDSSSGIGIYAVGSNGRIRGNHVHGIPATSGCGNENGGAGIDAGDYTTHDIDIIGNVVHDVGPFPANGLAVSNYCNGAHGICHATLRGRIANNISYRNAAWGIHLWHAANNIIIENNVSFNNGAKTDIGNFLGGGITFGAGDSPGGVTTDNVTVANNIVYGNRGLSIYEFGATGSGNRLFNNLVFSNGSNPPILQTGTATGTVNADPKFVNYQANGGGDYHVMTGSPAIDGGSTNCAALPGNGNCAPDLDMDGATRPSGAAIDIGAYESGAAPAAWPWY